MHENNFECRQALIERRCFFFSTQFVVVNRNTGQQGSYVYTPTWVYLCTKACKAKFTLRVFHRKLTSRVSACELGREDCEVNTIHM